MFCRKCGRKLEKGAIQCRKCKEPVDTAGICGGFRGLTEVCSEEDLKAVIDAEPAGPGRSAAEDLSQAADMVRTRTTPDSRTEDIQKGEKEQSPAFRQSELRTRQRRQRSSSGGKAVAAAAAVVAAVILLAAVGTLRKRVPYKGDSSSAAAGTETAAEVSSETASKYGTEESASTEDSSETASNYDTEESASRADTKETASAEKSSLKGKSSSCYRIVLDETERDTLLDVIEEQGKENLLPDESGKLRYVLLNREQEYTGSGKVIRAEFYSADPEEPQNGDVIYSVEYEYTEGENGEAGPLEKKTIIDASDPDGGKSKTVLDYSMSIRSWEDPLIVRETIKSTGYNSSEPEDDREYTSIRYTYTYNLRWDEYNLESKEYFKDGLPVEGPMGVRKVFYSGYEKEEEKDSALYCISETFSDTADSEEDQKESVTVNGCTFDEIRYYYDGASYTLRKMKYYLDGKNVEGPDGFHYMKCRTEDDSDSREEHYYDRNSRPVEVDAASMFCSEEDLCLLYNDEFKMYFFRKDLQE